MAARFPHLLPHSVAKSWQWTGYDGGVTDTDTVEVTVLVTGSMGLGGLVGSRGVVGCIVDTVVVLVAGLGGVVGPITMTTVISVAWLGYTVAVVTSARRAAAKPRNKAEYTTTVEIDRRCIL